MPIWIILIIKNIGNKYFNSSGHIITHGHKIDKYGTFITEEHIVDHSHNLIDHTHENISFDLNYNDYKDDDSEAFAQKQADISYNFIMEETTFNDILTYPRFVSFDYVRTNKWWGFFGVGGFVRMSDYENEFIGKIEEINYYGNNTSIQIETIGLKINLDCSWFTGPSKYKEYWFRKAYNENNNILSIGTQLTDGFSRPVIGYISSTPVYILIIKLKILSRCK